MENIFFDVSFFFFCIRSKIKVSFLILMVLGFDFILFLIVGCDVLFLLKIWRLLLLYRGLNLMFSCLNIMMKW